MRGQSQVRNTATWHTHVRYIQRPLHIYSRFGLPEISIPCTVSVTPSSRATRAARRTSAAHIRSLEAAAPAFWSRSLLARRLVASTVRSPPPHASPRLRSYEAPGRAARLLGWAPARPRCALTARPSPAPIRRSLGPPVDEEEVATWSTRCEPPSLPSRRSRRGSGRGETDACLRPPHLSPRSAPRRPVSPESTACGMAPRFANRSRRWR